jgi:hypothetical protein
MESPWNQEGARSRETVRELRALKSNFVISTVSPTGGDVHLDLRIFKSTSWRRPMRREVERSRTSPQLFLT